MKKIIFTFLICLVGLGKLHGAEVLSRTCCESYILAKQDEYAQKLLMQAFLDTFCKRYYVYCFPGRTYIEDSLVVSRVTVESDKRLRIEGTHSYKGRFGRIYRNYDFFAVFKDQGDTAEVVFHKKSAPDLFNENAYWETCTKTIKW